MKRLLYIFLAIVLVSCSDLIEPQGRFDEDCIVLNVFNSPMTKAVDATGEDYERKLVRLDCFFYVKGESDPRCVYYQKVDLLKYAAAEIPLYVDESIINDIFPGSNTECDVFVIANLPEEKTFTENTDATKISALSKMLLDLEEGEYDAKDRNFIMAGSEVVTKGNNNNASGTVPLYRAAAKITVSVRIPAYIDIDGTVSGTGSTVRMTPVLSDDRGNVTLKSAFHHGASKTYLCADYADNQGNTLLQPEDQFITEEKTYKYVSTVSATATEPEKYVYACEVPFYTYARAWKKGAEDAAFITLELPWRNVTSGGTVTPYYYQILVNAAGREFSPNSWYDLIVNVGVLGSTIESVPTVIEDLTYYVLDWTTEPDPEYNGGGDRYENIVMEQYTYLVVPKNRLELSNVSSGSLQVIASHNIGIQMHRFSKEVESLPGTKTDEPAFYVNCGGDKPVVEKLSVSKSNFAIDNLKGTVTFNYEIPENVYSPVYVYATVWLDIDGDGTIDDVEDDSGLNEQNFVEHIVIVQYPAMYIHADKSEPYSIFVNNQQHSNQNTDYKIGNHTLGRIPGVSGSWGTKDSYMYTVAVSSFKSSDEFKAHDGKMYPYIIGDPRQRTSDLELDDNPSSTVATNWVTADAVETDANGNVIKGTDGEIQYEIRTLQHYYPTAQGGDSFRIVSPKFRIVSFHSSGWGNITSKGAAMRCATFQEDGYPAGRWRLPTEAEIMFIIDLQKAGVISDIFYGGSQYFCATEVNNTTRYKISYPQNGTPSWTSGTTGSVRCVYDEWFWGSEREAKKNANWNGTHTSINDDEYLFTWGDKEIW